MGTKQKVYEGMVLNRPKFTNVRFKYEAAGQSVLQWKGNPEPPWNVVELKGDGIWGQMVIEGTSVKVYSRNGTLKDEFKLAVPFSPWGYFRDSGEDDTGYAVGGSRIVLHGEFMFGTNWSKRRKLTGQFMAFDLVEFGGQCFRDKPQWTRRAFLEQVVFGKPSAGLPSIATHSSPNPLSVTSRGRIQCIPQWRTSRDEGITDLVQRIWADWVLAEDWEGLILKEGSAPFGEGWARIKRTYEVDYVCMGFRQSNADKYKGRMVKSVIGGLYVEGELKEAVRVSGLTEAQRTEMFDNPGKFVGRVFKVNGKGVFPNGAVRHPNFVEWHQDKQQQDCTIDSARAVGSHTIGEKV